jgi:hypothetical protein
MAETAVVPDQGGGSKQRTRCRNEDFHVHPADLGSLFAKRPLVLGEVEADYDTLLAKVTAAVKPADIVEAMWVKDVVDLMWEAQRLRRLRASLLMKAGRESLANLLTKSKNAGRMDGGCLFTIPELIAAYVAGDTTALAQVDLILREGGLDIHTLMARALAERLDDIERIERLISGADARRNRVLGEIERRRDVFARRLRLTVQEVTDVPFSKSG